MTKTLASALEEIKKRADKATPGPWMPCLGSGNHECTALMSESTDSIICDFLPDYLIQQTPDKFIRADMDFIEHARQDIPALLRVIELAVEALESIKVCNKNDGNSPSNNKGPHTMEYWRWQEGISRERAETAIARIEALLTQAAEVK